MSKQVLMAFIDDMDLSSKSKDAIKKEKKQIKTTKEFKQKKESPKEMKKEDLLKIYRAIKDSRGKSSEVNIENIKRKFFKTRMSPQESKRIKRQHGNADGGGDDEPKSVFTDEDFERIFKK